MRIKWTKDKIVKEIKKLERKNAKFAKNNFYALYGAALRYFGNWRKALYAAGYDYDNVAVCRHRSKEELLKDIRELDNKGSKYVQKHGGYIYSCAVREFGCWKNAIEAAGFDYQDITQDVEHWSKDKVIREIKLLDDKSAGVARKFHNKLLNAALKYCDTWEKAVTMSGFDYTKIRKASTQEEKLGNLLDQLCESVDRQKSFDWLKYKNRLHLDFYIESLNLAIEYNGEQHYRIVDFSGKRPERAKEQFKINRKRDAAKRRLLKKHGIKMIEIKYTEKLTMDNVKAILIANGINIA